MGKFHNDAPINGSSTAPDLLNRSSFANYLAETLLLNPDEECLTVSLEGEWGYGKTSVINLIKGALTEKGSAPITMEYNPWLVGHPEALVQDFLLQFAEVINKKDSSSAALSASKALVAYASLFGVAKLVPGAEPWATVIENVLSATGIATKKIAELKKLNLFEQKKKVAAAVRRVKRPIVVLIDDIDRLTPEETFQVLRLVKSVADFSGTSFLLAFDPNYLTDVLQKNGIVKSSEYINKVIQLRVSLPLISEKDLEVLTDIELEKLQQHHTRPFPDEQERLSWTYHRYFKLLIRNPRELKKFFNHFQFVLDQVQEQVSFTDLFCLSLLHTKSPKIYEHIKQNPRAYIGCTFEAPFQARSNEDVAKELAPERDDVLKSYPKEKVLIEKLLGELFPLLTTGGFAPYQASNNDGAGRISAPQRLYVALHYATPTGYVSDSDLLQFIQGKLDRNEFLRNTIEDETIERFLELMSVYAEQLKDNAPAVLNAILDVYLTSQRMKESLQRELGFFSSSLYDRVRWAIYDAINASKNKKELIEHILGNPNSVPMFADIVYKARAILKDPAEKEAWLTPEELEKIEHAFSEKAKRALETEAFKNTGLESHIFFELKRSSTTVTQQLAEATLRKGKGKGIVRLAEIVGKTGTDSTKGEYSLITRDIFDEILNFDELQQEASQIELDSLPFHIQATLKSIINGKKYYLRDASEGEAR